MLCLGLVVGGMELQPPWLYSLIPVWKILIFCCLLPCSNPVLGGCEDGRGHPPLGTLFYPLCPGVQGLGNQWGGAWGCCANCQQWLLTFGCRRANLHCNVLLEWLRDAQPGMSCCHTAQPWIHFLGMAVLARVDRRGKFLPHYHCLMTTNASAKLASANPSGLQPYPTDHQNLGLR